MGLIKETLRKGKAQVKGHLAEAEQETTWTANRTETRMPSEKARPEDVRRNTGRGDRHTSNSVPKTDPFGNQLISDAKNSKLSAPVPLNTTPSFATVPIPRPSVLPESRPQVNRKPTTQRTLDNSKSQHPGADEKLLPQPGLAQSESRSKELLPMTVDGTHDTPARVVVAETESEQPFSQMINEQLRIDERLRFDALRQETEALRKENQIMSVELAQERKKNGELKQAWQKATAAAVSASRQEANYKVGDDQLRSQYQEIIFGVSGWVTKYCVSDPKGIADSELRVFQSLTPQPHKYLKAKRTWELLLQSLVMHMLVDAVLNIDSNRGLWWAGKQSPGLRAVQSVMEPDEPHVISTSLKDGSLETMHVRNYSSWKAKTALLLSEKVAPAAIENNIEVILFELKPQLKLFVQRTELMAWKDLGDVIYDAIVLDLEFNKSRALFKVHRWSVKDVEDMRFDGARMVSPVGVQAAQSGMPVELVLAPMITKTGNADGEAFELLSLMCPWTVICKENRKQLQKK